MNHKEGGSSVVMVCGLSTGGDVHRLDQICNLNASKIVAAEDTIFALTNAGVYDVFTLTLAVNSPALGIDGGLTHNVLLSAEGELYAWGVGQYGELGLGPQLTDIETPGQVRCSSRVTAVACGNSHSCAVDSFGNVYAWGQNFSRQLGLYTKSRAELPLNAVIEELVMTPRVLPFSIKNSVAKVVCGAEFTMAVTKAGGLWTWGAGESGQLGTGRCKTKEVPSECVVRVGGRPARIRDAAAGIGHSCALTEEGKVVVWGLNKLGQLGTDNNNTIHEPYVLSTPFAGRAVYARDNCTACVSEDGALYTWGCGSSYRLLHGDCRTVYTPKRVEALCNEDVSQFIFSSVASAVLIKTRLSNVSPGIGMLKSFHSMELSGCGFWPSSSIVVKFTRTPDPAEDADNPAALVPPRSCMGQLAGPGLIACKPPRLTHTGYYDVSLAMDGKNFLAETKRVFICTDPTVINIENCLYDLRESECVDIAMTCTGLDEIGPGLDVYVRLVNCDDPSLCSPPMLAELLPEDAFAEEGEDDGAQDDQSVGGGSIASAASFDQNDIKETPVVPSSKRRIMCRSVYLSALKNRSGATLMLQAQLSRNAKDYAAANETRIICHEFTPTEAYPNCVPFASQREITFRGSGFFPLGMQAAIAITTHVDAVPIEDKQKKKSKKGVGKNGARPNTPVSPENSVTEGLNEMPSIASLMSMASIGSFIMESNSPAFHVLTVPVRFDSVSELAICIPALSEFVRPGLKLPDKMPTVLKAQILFSLASDSTASLSKSELDFFFYQDTAITVAPALCRRFSGQSFTFSGVGNWLSFMPNAARLIFSDKESDFIQTLDVKAVPSEDGDCYMLLTELPGNERKHELEVEAQAKVEGEDEVALVAPAILEQSESFLERPQITYRSLQVGLLLDGVTPPEESNMCTVQIFDQVAILELANALPKEGAVKGSTVTYVASGLLLSEACIVRLRGINGAHIDLAGSISAVDDKGGGTFSFQMPDTLADIECHVKGKEKSVYVDVSIDGGSTWDKSEIPILIVGKY